MKLLSRILDFFLPQRRYVIDQEPVVDFERVHPRMTEDEINARYDRAFGFDEVVRPLRDPKGHFIKGGNPPRDAKGRFV